MFAGTQCLLFLTLAVALAAPLRSEPIDTAASVLPPSVAGSLSLDDQKLNLEKPFVEKHWYSGLRPRYGASRSSNPTRTGERKIAARSANRAYRGKRSSASYPPTTKLSKRSLNIDDILTYNSDRVRGKSTVKDSKRVKTAEAIQHRDWMAGAKKAQEKREKQQEKQHEKEQKEEQKAEQKGEKEKGLQHGMQGKQKAKQLGKRGTAEQAVDTSPGLVEDQILDANGQKARDWARGRSTVKDEQEIHYLEGEKQQDILRDRENAQEKWNKQQEKQQEKEKKQREKKQKKQEKKQEQEKQKQKQKQKPKRG